MRNKMWTSLIIAISFVDKLGILSTTGSTVIYNLSTRLKLAAVAGYTKMCTKTFPLKQMKFSSFYKTASIKQLRTKICFSHKSTSSTHPTSYCIYNYLIERVVENI